MTDDRIDLANLEPADGDERQAAALAVARLRGEREAVAALERLTTFERALARNSYGQGCADVADAVEAALGMGETIRADLVRAAARNPSPALDFNVREPHAMIFADRRAAELVVRTRELARHLDEAARS